MPWAAQKALLGPSQSTHTQKGATDQVSCAAGDNSIMGQSKATYNSTERVPRW
jgi:hypothetical protein